MDADDVIAAVKITGALLGGALGVLGLLFNFRRPNKRISGWGIVVLAGIVLSAVVGVAGSIVEARKAKTEATQQAARTERLLREVNRTIQPITQLKITYWVRLPSDAPQVRGYLAKVSKGIEASLDVLRRETFVKPNDGATHITASGLDDEPLSIQIGRKSDLWPRGKDSDIASLVGAFKFDVFIRKKPLSEDNFVPMRAVGGQYADWIATSFFSGHNDLIFNRKDGKLELFGKDDYTRDLWQSNGRIASILDLHGSQLFLVAPTPLPPAFPERYKKWERPGLDELSRLVDLKTVRLRFSEGRDMWIDGAAFKKAVSKFGSAMFSIVLPADDEGFQRIAPRE